MLDHRFTSPALLSVFLSLSLSQTWFIIMPEPSWLRKKAIVIGAGVGGTSTAARLAHAGLDVEVYEKNEYSGGRCSLIHHDGYRFDQVSLRIPSDRRQTVFFRCCHFSPSQSLLSLISLPFSPPPSPVADPVLTAASGTLSTPPPTLIRSTLLGPRHEAGRGNPARSM